MISGSIRRGLVRGVEFIHQGERCDQEQAIIADILTGLLDAGRALVIHGRAEAVTSAIMQAKEQDVVLVAGKGHEDYQLVGNRRLDYSDRTTVARLLGVVA